MPAAKLFGEPSRLIQMVDIANMGIYFGIAKDYNKNFTISINHLYHHQQQKLIYLYFLVASTIYLLPNHH